MDSADKEMTAVAPTGSGLVLCRMIAERDLLRAPLQQAVVAAMNAVEVSFERAAATALGRAAEKLHRLPIFVEKVEFAPMSVPELAEFSPERALLAVLESGRDALGVMSICPGLLTSLIEMQALGRVTTRAPAPRRATRTDAAISADFVNGFLNELGRELGGRDDSPAFGSFRYATYLDDVRTLSLMLEDGDMIRLTLKFRIGSGGQRDGSIMVALPVAGMPRKAARPTHPMLAGPDASAPAPGVVAEAPVLAPTLAAAMQDAPVRVVGVLCRRSLTLRTLRSLTPGSMISLPQNALDDARVETTSGQLIARGRLGEAEGMHAIRLRAQTSDARPTDPLDTPADGATATEPPVDDLHRPDPFRTPGMGLPSAKQGTN